MIEGLMIAMLLGGSFFILIAGIGILRLQDILSQAHPIAKVTTLGINLILIAAAFALWDTLSTIKLLFIIIFHFITIPIAGHIFARYAAQYDPKD